jgi:acetyl esterase/lipase
VGNPRRVAGPALDAFLAELRAFVESANMPAQRFAYGPHPDQHADLRLPGGEGPHPVAVVLHGGFWRAAYTKTNTEAIAIALTRAGWATWNVEYRRVGAGGGFPETLDDVAAACRALQDVPLPLALGSCAAIGHSAGGQLALWLAGEQLVRAAVALAGVCDLAAGAAAGIGGGAVLEFLGGTPAQTPGRYARADPSKRLPNGRRQLLAHGDLDDRVPLAQSTGYRDAARAAGDACELLVLEGADHFDVIDPRSAAWPRILETIASLEVVSFS